MRVTVGAIARQGIQSYSVICHTRIQGTRAVMVQGLVIFVANVALQIHLTITV